VKVCSISFLIISSLFLGEQFFFKSQRRIKSHPISTLNASGIIANQVILMIKTVALMMVTEHVIDLTFCDIDNVQISVVYMIE